jgi:putative DNA modification/repair radical SAM protein
MDEKLKAKLAILADAAKYDASCASSGGTKRNALASGGLGSVEGSGICHAYAPDGRCISLLKILLTNSCIFDCAYCINRRSSNVQRARFTVAEVVDLTLSFYRRNYIEGLFLSSGIIRSSDYTMEQLVAVARTLREEHQFRGYIHLKTIPDAAPELIEEAGRHADRLSINIELPREEALAQYAPEKDGRGIRKTMGTLRLKLDEHRDRDASPKRAASRQRRFAPAGQSTQMIIGADPSTDADVLTTSSSLYSGYQLRRVYYSAFSPIPDASHALPVKPAPLVREHRLYQADWMLRFYGFALPEIVAATDDGMLDLAVDPKLAWALRHRQIFPVDVNSASYEQLLRVPGLGPRAVKRILASRRWRRLRLEDVGRVTRSIVTARAFLTAEGWHPGRSLDAASLRDRIVARQPTQLSLFG